MRRWQEELILVLLFTAHIYVISVVSLQNVQDSDTLLLLVPFISVNKFSFSVFKRKFSPIYKGMLCKMATHFTKILFRKSLEEREPT